MPQTSTVISTIQRKTRSTDHRALFYFCHIKCSSVISVTAAASKIYDENYEDSEVVLFLTFIFSMYMYSQ